jgi:hypothetical protein
MEGIDDFDHGVVYNKWADSDNLSAGYTLPPVSWEQAIHDKYLARGGWSVVGSTAFLWDFSPGRSPGSLCGSGPIEGWYQCGFYDINGVWRDGRIQTFRGAGSGDGQHAIFKRSSGSAVFMSRGLLGPLTTLVGAYSDGHDVMWLVGYPTGDSYWVSGTQVRMNFQNGYALYTPSTCATIFYWYSADNGVYYPWDAPDACD